MTFRPSIFTVVLLSSAVVATALAVVVWRRRTVGSRAFAAMLVASALWCVGDAGQYGATTIEAYRVWATLGFVGAATVGTAALVFALQYAGFEEWVTSRSVGLLAVEPAVTVVLAVTNPWHHLLWRYTGAMRFEPVTYVQSVSGPWWTIHLLYTYTVLAAVFGSIGLFYLRSRGVYRQQAALMLIGALVPTSLNLLWLLDASPIPGVDLSSMTFVLTGAIFAVALYRFDLLDVNPVASHRLVEGLRDGVVAVDSTARVVDANPVARRMLGADLVGEPAATVIPEYESIVADLDNDGVPESTADADVTLPVDGENRTFDVSTSSLAEGGRDGGGRVFLFRDVTERRRVERRYRSLIENASDLIHVVDPDGTIDYVSPSSERILGYAPGDIEGTNALSYIHPEDRDEVAARLSEITDDGVDDLHAEFRVLTPEGDTRVLDARAQDLQDDPAVGGIVVNSRDVTRRNRRERALRRQNEQLEEFTSVISHDLRNPLAVARGYAGVLEEESDDHRIEKVVDAHERMDELLKDLLALAREGRTVDETTAVDVETVARQSWATVDTDGATLAVPAEGTVMADESRLRQLFENLFRNAREHAGDGTRVTVDDLQESPETAANAGDGRATGRSDGGAGVVGFYVEDDGPGIPADEREDVFEVGVTSAEEGTGFGLTIVRRIAEAHGWKVTVTDGTDDGARFEFSDVAVPE